MRFHVYSIEQMEGLANWHPPKVWPHAIIGVTDPETRTITLPIGPMTKGVLRLKFRDKVTGPDLFTRDQADQILAFVKEHTSSVEGFLVHCGAGLSRSHAIAAALAKGVFGQDNIFHWLQGNPNQLVYDTLMEAARAGT
jgi:predicted protein tyrosine phosphatase